MNIAGAQRSWNVPLKSADVEYPYSIKVEVDGVVQMRRVTLKSGQTTHYSFAVNGKRLLAQRLSEPTAGSSLALYAKLELKVPAKATVTLKGKVMKNQSGEVRSWRIPIRKAGVAYGYPIQVSLNGQELSGTARVEANNVTKIEVRLDGDGLVLDEKAKPNIRLVQKSKSKAAVL